MSRVQEAILLILHVNDVVITMATGSGKSLWMFLPPLVCGTVAIAVILSLLTGLMDDQVCFYILFGLQHVVNCVYEWLVSINNCPVPTYSCVVGHHSIRGQSFAEHFQGLVN